MRTAFLLTSCLMFAGCSMTSSVGRPSRPALVTPSGLAASPAAYDGKMVQVTGLLVWESDHLGLYQSYGAFCRGAEKSAIYVDWSKWPGVTKADDRRQVTVRGTFRNQFGTPQQTGAVVIANGAPGPGPLAPGAIVGWLGSPEKPCPRAMP